MYKLEVVNYKRVKKYIKTYLWFSNREYVVYYLL